MWVVKKHTKGYYDDDSDWVTTVSEHSTEEEANAAATDERADLGWPWPTSDWFSVEYE